MNTATPENPRLADKHAVHFGGCSMRLLVTFILATLMSVGFFDASAAAEEAGPCGLSTGDVAIAACSRLIKGNPKNVFALVSRGNAYKDKGDFDHAISDYSEAIRLNPKYALAFNNRGNAYRAKGDLDYAISDYNEAIRLDPKYAFAFNDRGNAYRDKGDLDHAISDYNEALRLDPKYGLAFFNRGNAYLAKNEADRAIVDFNQAIRLDPKNVFALVSRGKAYKDKGDLDRAISDYNEAIRLDPKYAFAFNDRGNAYLAKNEADRAIVDFSEAIRLDPKNVFALVSRGKAYKDKGDLDRAISDYNEAIRLDPKAAFAFNRGNAYLAKYDEDRAIADFNEAIRLDSHNPTFLIGRATCYVRLANLDAAIADLDQAIVFNPKLAAAYRMRGDAYRAERNFDHAIADYDQSLQIDPRDSRVLIDRALAHDAKGDDIQTDQDYQRVLAARLTISKRYPREAARRREEGVVRVAFSLDREGKVTSTRVELSSGSATLDEEALAMIERAQPFPPLPDQSKDRAEFTIPIAFRLSPIIATAASLTATSALAENAPANLERPTSQTAQEAPHSDRWVPESELSTWYQKLVAHLDKYKRNPHGRLRRDAAVVIRFVLDRAGHIVSAKVEKTSGDAVTDDAALAIMRRADPLPAPPSFGTNEQLHFVVPIRFSVGRRSQS